MKVLLAARWPVGGIRSFLLYLYSDPLFEQAEFELVAPDEGLAEFFSSSLSHCHFNVTACGTRTREIVSSLRKRVRAGNFDLLHTHGLTTAALGQFARIGSGVPHLMSIHDLFLPETFTGPIGRVRQVALNALLRNVDAVHAVSEDCGTNFREYVPLIPAFRVHPILSGIDTTRFANARPVNAHFELGVPSDAKLIGFFGRFMAPKGFRTLIDAIELIKARLQEPNIRVVTFGWGGFIREDFAYLNDRGLKELFIQMPHTDHPERWMKAMDVIAMPSKWEACGLVAMEALAAGVPIVGTDCMGLREVLAGSPAKTVRPGDHAALAEQILFELASSRSAEFMSYKDVAAERFSGSRQASKMISLYRKLINGSCSDSGG